jgi:methylthioribose-1-phosphate isomerase
LKVAGKPWRTIWLGADGWSVEAIDQTRLPAELVVVRFATLDDAARAIRTMQVRGAPLIGVAAAFGLCLALREDPSDAGLERAVAALLATRPTAVNLRHALERMRTALAAVPPAERVSESYRIAAGLADGSCASSRVASRTGRRCGC